MRITLLGAAMWTGAIACSATSSTTDPRPKPSSVPPDAASVEPVSTAAPVDSAPKAKIGAARDANMKRAVVCSGNVTELHALESGLLGTCGIGVSDAAAFFIGSDDEPRATPDAFRALPASSAAFGIVDVNGKDLDDLEASVTELRTCVSARYAKRAGKWTKLKTTPFAGGAGSPWAGVAIGDRRLSHRPREKDEKFEFRYDDGKPGWTPPTTIPFHCGTPADQLGALHLEGGTLFAVGSACGKLVAHRWTYGSKAAWTQTLDWAVKPPFVSGVLRPMNGGRMYFSAIADGAPVHAVYAQQKWKPLKIPEGFRPSFHHPATLWEEPWFWDDDAVGRIVGDEMVTIPAPGEIRDVVASLSELRVLTRKGLYALDGDTWHPLTIDVDDKVFQNARLAWSAGRFVLRYDEGEGADRKIVLQVERAQGPVLEVKDNAPAVPALEPCRSKPSSL